MSWNADYAKDKQIWGYKPSELAVTAVRYLKKNKLNSKVLDVVDVGCGYGRDAFYFLDNLKCRVLGIDISEKAIEIAIETVLRTKKEKVKFQRLDFRDLKDHQYDAILIANLYHLLKKDEREELGKVANRALNLNGLLFLNAISVRDPEHYGKGTNIPGEANSFQDSAYRHLFTSEELIKDLAFLNIKELFEQEFYEEHTSGKTHHHISWMLIGEHKPSTI